MTPGCTGRGKALKPWGQRESTLADLPRVLRSEGAPKEYPVRVVLQSQRYRCSVCSKVFSHMPAKVKAPHSNMTVRLWEWVAQESLTHSNTAIAERSGLDEKQVRRALEAYSRSLADAVRIRTPACMALVSLAVLRRQRLVVINAQAQCIVDLLPTPGLDSLSRYASGLRDPHAVGAVSIGLLGSEGPATVDALRKAFPQALVMIDGPHVLATVRSIANLSEQDGHQGDEAIKTIHSELSRLYHSDADEVGASECFERLFGGLTKSQRKTFALLVRAWETQRQELLGFFTAEGRAASLQPLYDRLGDLESMTPALEGLTSRGNFDVLRRALLYPERMPARSVSTPGTGIPRFLAERARLAGEGWSLTLELNDQMLQVLRQRMRDEGVEPPDPSMRGISRAKQWAGWRLQLPQAMGEGQPYYSVNTHGSLEKALLQAQIERDRRLSQALEATSAPSEKMG